jgi:hypothetical protein
MIAAVEVRRLSQGPLGRDACDNPLTGSLTAVRLWPVPQCGARPGPTLAGPAYLGLMPIRLPQVTTTCSGRSRDSGRPCPASPPGAHVELFSDDARAVFEVDSLGIHGVEGHHHRLWRVLQTLDRQRRHGHGSIAVEQDAVAAIWAGRGSGPLTLLRSADGYHRAGHRPGRARKWRWLHSWTDGPGRDRANYV